MKRLAPWFLVGVLAASVGINVYLAADLEKTPPGEPAPLLPGDIGITPEQRAKILC